MRSQLQDWKTGWYGIWFGLKKSEARKMRELLGKLLDGELDHIHFRGDFDGDGGIGDVEFGLIGDEEGDDLSL